jgi:predicted small lipoprotein YifL
MRTSSKISIASAFAVLALFAGCGAPKHPVHLPDARGNAAPIKEVATVDHAEKITLEPFETVNHLFRNAKSQIPTGVRLAVLDSADWAAIWKRIVGSSSTAPKPEIDFSREMLLVVGMGQAPCMGYQINVDTVFRDKGQRIYAVVRERHHGARCGCLNEVVSPVDVIRVPRSLRPVTFLERQETNVCEERDGLQTLR